MIWKHAPTLNGLLKRVNALEEKNKQLEERMSAVDDLVTRMNAAVQKIQDNEATEDAEVAAKIEPAVVHLEAMAQGQSTPMPPPAQ